MNNNIQKMREAIKVALDYFDNLGTPSYEALSVLNILIDAYKKWKPRNCDIGTVDEQINRHYRYCSCRLGDGDDPHGCGHISCSECVLLWAQEEYKEEEK